MKDFTKQFLSITLLLLILFIELQAQNETQPRQVSSLENHIHSLVKEITETCKTTQSLSEEDFASLPIGISPKGCGGTGTTIVVVDSAYRNERGNWFLSLYASIVLPGTTSPIAFAA